MGTDSPIGESYILLSLQTGKRTVRAQLIYDEMGTAGAKGAETFQDDFYPWFHILQWSHALDQGCISLAHRIPHAREHRPARHVGSNMT